MTADRPDYEYEPPVYDFEMMHLYMYWRGAFAREALKAPAFAFIKKYPERYPKVIAEFVGWRLTHPHGSAFKRAKFWTASKQYT
jgi:hypothetical protein